MTDVLKEALALKEYCTGCRQTVHQNPELSFQEFQTTAFIRRQLEEMGVEILPLELETGLVAIIRGGLGDGPVTGLRADIDALPLTEESGVPYSSQNPGAAHSCGHDGHVAVLLGVAKLLHQWRDRFSGVVKLIFQPGEEGLYGALKIVQSGALKDPDVEEVVCLHGWPYLKVGEVGVWPGEYMASADMFRITVRGKSAHGASPESGVNPVQILCQIYNGLQSIECSEKPRGSALALTIGQISAGRAGNVIPEQGFMCGSIRAYEENVRSLAKRRLKEISEQTAAMYGGRAEVEFPSELPATVNDLQVGDEMFGYVKELVGEEGTMMLPQIMGGEDFAEVLKEAPGVLFRVSLGDKQEGYPYISHNSKVIFNESGMKHAVAAFAHCAVRWLNAH